MKTMQLTAADADVIIPKKKIKKLISDAASSAEAVNLVYVNGNNPGITRMDQGKGFAYFFGTKKINSSKDLQRIQSLVIPPAWKNVWICTQHKGHLQVTGTDILNRKQYRYHTNCVISFSYPDFLSP